MELNDTDLEKDKPNDKSNNKKLSDLTTVELIICIIDLPIILLFCIFIFFLGLIALLLQLILKNINFVSIGIIIILGFMLLKKYCII